MAEDHDAELHALHAAMSNWGMFSVSTDGSFFLPSVYLEGVKEEDEADEVLEVENNNDVQGIFGRVEENNNRTISVNLQDLKKQGERWLAEEYCSRSIQILSSP